MSEWPHDLKLQRAGQHLKELQAEIGRWQRDGYTVSVEPDPDPKHREYEVKAFILRQPEPDPFSLLIGDFLQNARAALDYIAFAFGNLGAPGGWMTDEVALKTQFPIIGDVDKKGLSGRGPDLFREAAARRLPTVAEPVRALIEQSQPYYTGGHDGWQFEPLWVLNELARFDRHRFLQLAVVRTGDVRGHPVRFTNFGINELTVVGPGRQVIEDEPRGDDDAHGGAVIARVTGEVIDRKKQMEMEFLTELVIGFDADSLPPTTSMLDSEEIGWTLRKIEIDVEDVFRTLSPHLPPVPPY